MDVQPLDPLGEEPHVGAVGGEGVVGQRRLSSYEIVQAPGISVGRHVDEGIRMPHHDA